MKLIKSLPSLEHFFKISIVVSVIFYMVKILLNIVMGTAVNHVSGVWMGLAYDLNDGIFYRPLFNEEIGIGGTRYFPLFFMLYSGILKIFENPLIAGHILNIFIGISLFITCYLFLIKRGVKFLITISMVLLLLTFSSLQFSLETIRVDLLPLALNVLGLYLYLNYKNSKYVFVIVGICFILAFLSKMTSINGILALSVYMLLIKETRLAFKLLLFTGIGYILSLFVIQYFSSGRFFDIFLTCSTGGESIDSMLFSVFFHSIINIVQKIVVFEPILLLLLFSIPLIFWNNNIISLELIFFIATIINSLLIISSPGIDFNHLVDLSVASILLIGTNFAENNNKYQKKYYMFYILIILISIIYYIPNTQKELKTFISGHYKQKFDLIEYIKNDNGIIVSEDPLITIMAHDSRPYLLDPFTVDLISKRYKNYKIQINNKILNKEFSKIIFQRDPESKIDFYYNSHFGKDFIHNVFKNYQKAKVFNEYYVYVPK
jgi:hypothetical protein